MHTKADAPQTDYTHFCYTKLKYYITHTGTENYAIISKNEVEFEQLQ
jgi:hypothetical protein